jgi:cytochrome bd-type quinol oxidase subunit 2
LIVILAGLIPEVFNVGMETAGRLLTRVFSRYNTLALGACAILLGCALFRVWISQTAAQPAAAPSPAEWLVLGTLVLSASLITWVLFPGSVLLQEQAFAAKEELAKADAYRTFFRSHNLVRTLYVLNLALAVALMILKVRRWAGGGAIRS